MTRRKPSKFFWRDLTERVIATFLQGALGTLTAGQIIAAARNNSDAADPLIGALGGGLAALLALVKGWAARKVGDPESASLLDD